MVNDNELNRLTGSELKETAFGFKVQLFSDKRAVIEGHRGAMKIDSSQIVLKAAKSRLTVFGENLSIEYYSQGLAIICGRIKSVSVGE